MPGFVPGQDPNRFNAMELVISSFEDIKSEFYEVLYGEHLWKEILPEASLDTSINPGATTTSYRVTDWKGKAAFRSQFDDGIPTVGQTIDKNIIKLEAAGVSAVFDREDARQIAFGYDQSLLQELPRIMRKACENHVEGTFFYGDPELGFLGWLDYPGVDVIVAPNGAGGNSEWSTKTSDEIQFDINQAITTVWVNTRQVHMPNQICLPPALIGLISSKRMSTAADKSVLDYVKQNNIYTATTGRELEFKSVRYLDGAGVAGVKRMVARDTNPRNMKLPFPLQFELLEPQKRGYTVELFAEYKFGTFHMPYPGSMNYTDGI